MNKPVFRERVSENLISEFDLGRWDTLLFGLLKVKKKSIRNLQKICKLLKPKPKNPKNLGFFSAIISVFLTD